MVYKLIIKPLAEIEIAEALEWYDKEKEGLGLELLRQIDECLELISKNSECFQKRYREVKIVFTKRFPYGVHYTSEFDVIYVHAVLHTKRRPRAQVKRGDG